MVISLRDVISIDFLDTFAAGIYLLFGIVHLDLWLKRRDRPGHLWLCIAAGGALLVDVTGMAIRASKVPFGLLPSLNLVGVAVVTLALFELVRSLRGGRAGTWMRAAWIGGIVLGLVAGSAAIDPLVGFFFTMSMIMLVSAFVLALREGIAGDREARAMAAGLVVLLLALMFDVLRELHVIHGMAGVPVFGFSAMFLISASSLNGRYEREHRELVALREDLEQRVSERTRELEDVNRKLEEASRTDSLTGLPNRRGFLDVVDHELKRSARAGQTCSFVMIDLDHFKRINDRYGHAAGDAVLRTAASCLRGVLRAADVVARWGGEEFIVLLPDTPASAAAGVAEKARHALASCGVQPDAGGESITASFGVAAHTAGQPLEVTIAAADAALYRAKEAGRDRVLIAQETGTEG